GGHPDRALLPTVTGPLHNHRRPDATTTRQRRRTNAACTQVLESAAIRTGTLLDEITSQVDDALETLRALARRIFPPVLAIGFGTSSVTDWCSAHRCWARRCSLGQAINTPTVDGTPSARSH